MIDVRDLCKDYPVTRSLGSLLRHPFLRADSTRALDNISFTVNGGAIVAVVGLNGAGENNVAQDSVQSSGSKFR